jgi:hypothetical protein
VKDTTMANTRKSTTTTLNTASFIRDILADNPEWLHNMGAARKVYSECMRRKQNTTLTYVATVITKERKRQPMTRNTKKTTNNSVSGVMGNIREFIQREVQRQIQLAFA